jgi:hypothetical protein
MVDDLQVSQQTMDHPNPLQTISRRQTSGDVRATNTAPKLDAKLLMIRDLGVSCQLSRYSACIVVRLPVLVDFSLLGHHVDHVAAVPTILPSKVPESHGRNR